MYKFFKYSTITIIFIITALLIIPFLIPLDKYKEIAAYQVKEITGSDLEIHGDITLSLLPIPKIKIQDIKLSSLKVAQYNSSMEIKELMASISNLSLLNGKISFAKIKISEPIINLKNTNMDGTEQNLPDLTSSANQTTVLTSNEADIKRKKKEKDNSKFFDIKSFEVVSAKINYLKNIILLDNLEIKNFGRENQMASLKASIKDANISNIIPKNGKIRLIEGKADLNMDLKTEGYHKQQMLENLSGTTKLMVSEGKISGFDLKEIIDNLKKVKNINNVLDIFNSSFSRGETSFKNLNLNTTIEKGIANIDEFDIDANPIYISSTGNINLPKHKMNVESTVNINLKSAPELKIHSHGNINNLKHSLDVKSLKKHFVKELLNNAVKNLPEEQNPKKLLKKTLKDLF